MATILGTERNDRLIGTDEDDFIFGGGGNDRIYAGLGNDLMIGGAGVDSIDGGSGYDTVRFSGVRADYDISFQGGFWSVKDKNHRDGYDGQDHIVAVERIHFAGDDTSFFIGVAPLFNSGNDVVNFDTVVAGGYIEGTQYDAMQGDDVVALWSSAEQAAEAGYVWGTPFHGGHGNDSITAAANGQVRVRRRGE